MTEAEIRAAALREAAVICDATADRLNALNAAGKLSGIQGLAWPIEQAARAIRELATAPTPSQPTTPDKFDDVLLPFLTLMRRELHANTGKGDRPGWLKMDANTALLEVYWHAAKLSAAVKNNDGPAIQEHSADVANMAMMVLDVCGGLVWVDATPTPSGAPADMTKLREALQDIATHGLRIDGNPTLMFPEDDAERKGAITMYSWWVKYIREAQERLRENARAALAGAPATDAAPMKGQP